MGETLLMTMIGGRRAAIRAADIQSVVELEQIIEVPAAPDYVAGLAALRSRALTVIDACKAIGVSCSLPMEQRRAAVVDVAGHAYAILVEQADDVVEARAEAVRPDVKLGDGWDSIASGVVETGIGPAILIDIAALVAGAGLAGNQSLAA